MRPCHIPHAQAAQQAKKAEEAKEKPAAASGPQLEDDADDLDPNQYYERRLRGLAAIKAAGGNPYPHKWHVSTYLPQFVAKFGGLETGARLEETVSIAGGA